MAGIPAEVTGIFTIMLGASWLNRTAWLTMASVSRNKRGSVWMDRRPFRPACSSKIGRSREAAFLDISSTSLQPIWSSVALGPCSMSWLSTGAQRAISWRSTLTTMTGLQVAPTAPLSIE